MNARIKLLHGNIKVLKATNLN
uniref:Uncharacterized protein n=1 Tax=Vitis vinifera TaxID=29760 RepID=F6HNX9_VITVI